MRNLLAADSPLQRVLGRIADVMILNLLFVAASLPLVTIGASLTALNHAALKLIDDSPDSVVDTFLRSFRQNFRQATVLLGITVGAIAVLAAWLLVVMNLAIGPFAQGVAYVALALVALRVLVILCFLFPYQATFEGSTREVLGNARKMSARHPMAATALVLVLTLPVIITVLEPGLTGYGMLWLIFGFAAIACINGFLIRAVFARYIPRSAS